NRLTCERPPSGGVHIQHRYLDSRGASGAAVIVHWCAATRERDLNVIGVHYDHVVERERGEHRRGGTEDKCVFVGKARGPEVDDQRGAIRAGVSHRGLCGPRWRRDIEDGVQEGFVCQHIARKRDGVIVAAIRRWRRSTRRRDILVHAVGGIGIRLSG